MDDIRPKATVEVACTHPGCTWHFWVEALDPRLPSGPFLCIDHDPMATNPPSEPEPPIAWDSGEDLIGNLLKLGVPQGLAAKVSVLIDLMPSPVDTTKLRELEAKATQGTWTATGDTHEPIVVKNPPRLRAGYKPKVQPDTKVIALDNTAACGDPDCCADNPYVHVSAEDAALIVAMRNALPELLDALDRKK